MKLERVELSPVRYRLRSTLGSARAPLRERQGVRVRVRDEDGRSALGEALPLASAGTETLARTRSALGAAAGALRGASGELDELLDGIEARWPDAPAARCALDSALHELEARRLGLPVAGLLGTDPRTEVAVNALLGSGEFETVLARARDFVARGYETLKLKLGVDPPRADLERVARLRAGLGPSIRLRLDPNGAWPVPAAREMLERLAPLEVELVEQPLPASEWRQLRRLADDSPVPLAADECLALPEARRALADGDLTPLAVLKPMVLGGLRAAARLAERASAAGVRCFATTTLEGPAGTAAALQLAAAVCDPELACGLAGPEAVEAAFPAWLTPRRGRLRPGAAEGFGEGGAA